MTGGLLLWICVAGIGLLVLLSARPVGRPRLSLHRRLIQLRPDRPEGEPQPRLFGSPGLDSLLVPGLRSMGGAFLRVEAWGKRGTRSEVQNHRKLAIAVALVHSPGELILRRPLPHGGIEGSDAVTCLIEQNPSSLVVGIEHLVSGDHRGRVLAPSSTRPSGSWSERAFPCSWGRQR